MSEIIPALCALARDEIARADDEFLDAISAGDAERADRVAGEAADLAAALKRQEAAQ